MFKQARIRLTAWYLMIIMAISLSFSVVIYVGVNSELVRMDNAQKDRQARVDTMRVYLQQNSLPVPPENLNRDSETLETARLRIITTLGFVNIFILALSGIGGYFLAGLTLDPIQKMVKDQKEFVGDASHELRTPLTSLKTEIEVALRDKKLSLAGAKKLLQSNLDDVNGMQKLANYLLELNKFDNVDNKIILKNISLGEAVETSIDKLVPVASAKNIIIKKDITKVLVKGDSALVTELSTILIDNAIKYSTGKGKVEVVVTKEGVLKVKDFGIGISEKDLPHIFDRFYRADSSRSKEKADGYGLGLSIAKSISEKLSAKIEVRSTEKKGSIFTVKFILA